jgi:hypothetical protein
MIITAGFDPLRDEGHAQIHAFVSLTKTTPQGMACALEIAEYVRKRLA